MQPDQSALQAALERAAATMRNSGSNVGSGSGLFAPMAFGGPGMFNPAPMANQPAPGMQQTPNEQVASRFGGMQGAAQPTFADRFPQTMAQAPAAPQQPQAPQQVPMPMARPAAAPQAPAAPQQQMPMQATQEPGMQAFYQSLQAQAPQHHQGLIPNMLGFFGAGQQHTNANGSIQGAIGPTSVGGAPLQQPPQDQGGLIQKMLGALGSRMS